MGTVHRRQSGRGWDGVAAQAYADPAFRGVEKHELIGPADGAPHYRVRYFHVPPGGRTARETHAHDHGVGSSAGARA
jgi:quercetin dioxygenase-like cupin family protein